MLLQLAFYFNFGRLWGTALKHHARVRWNSPEEHGYGSGSGLPEGKQQLALSGEVPVETAPLSCRSVESSLLSRSAPTGPRSPLELPNET